MTVQSITHLTPRHNKILDYCIEGLTPKLIAEKLSISARQVGIIINSDSFQHQLAIRRQSFAEDHDNKLSETEVSDAHSILTEHAAAASKRLVAGLMSQSESIAIRSAESILDRTGTVKITRQEQDDKPIINISHDDLVLLNETLRLEKEIEQARKPKEIISTQEPEIKSASQGTKPATLAERPTN